MLESKLPDALLLGHQSGADLGRALASMDMLLNPSVTEAFGNVNLEAMACETPVVASAPRCSPVCSASASHPDSRSSTATVGAVGERVLIIGGTGPTGLPLVRRELRDKLVASQNRQTVIASESIVRVIWTLISDEALPEIAGRATGY